MKTLSKKTKITLTVLALVLAFVLSNLLTGYLVYKDQKGEYTALQSRIRNTIEQNQAMEKALDTYNIACPDVVLED